MPLYAEFFVFENLVLKNQIGILDTPKNLLHHIRSACPILEEQARNKISKLHAFALDGEVNL